MNKKKGNPMNQTIKVSELISEGNVRYEATKKSNPEYKALKENVKLNGFFTPITYRYNKDGVPVIIDGHQRVNVAKDLKLTEIPAFESNGTVDDITKQISSNLFKVSMTPLDASYAIDRMVAEGIVTTKKALIAKFGKNASWVERALAFCNIDEYIRNYYKTEPITERVEEYLIELSKTPLSIQRQAIESQDDIENEEDFKQVFINYSYYDDSEEEYLKDLVREVKTDKSKWEFICNTIGKETFREYEANHDVTHEYQNTLFQEYADEQWCKDNDFLNEVFLAETEIGQWLIKKEIHYNLGIYGDDMLYFDFGTKLSTLQKNLKKESGVGLKNISIDFWSGDVFNPRLCYTVTDTVVDENEDHVDDTHDADIDEATDRDPHWLKYNKFNKVAAPIIEKYLLDNIDPLKCNDCDLNEVFEWIMAVLDDRPGFDVGWYDEEKGDGHPLEHLINRSENYSNNELIQEMSHFWFHKYYPTADFRQLDELLKTQGLKSCKEILKDTYDKEQDEVGNIEGMVFRKAYLSVLSKAELLEFVNGEEDRSKNKSNLVQLIANQPLGELPYFDLVCTNRGSGSNNIGSYL